MGINHYLKGEHKKAYEFFKKGFEIGYPVHCQYSLKPTLSFHFLPKFLTRVCYTLEDYVLGEKASLFFLQNNQPNAEDYEEIKSYYMIFKKLNEYKDHKNKKIKNPNKKAPLFVFVADGGFNQWSGSNILTTGVGGSETYIIEMARYIKKNGQFDVIVFCNCEKDENFEGVEYKNLTQFSSFINENYVEHCMISRFTEYLPLAIKGFAENIYIVLHDLGPSGNVIPMHSKLKKIFCLSEWHVEYFTNQFPSLKSITVPFYYGIDFDKFKNDKNTIQKQKFKFIYSSFPNRGLLPLLQMWPEIYKMNNQASLHIYSDVNGKWVNNVDPQHMKEVKRLLQQNISLNIHYHGWVDKKTLSQAWLSSDIWLYPCIFMETFCLTALEAALTNTLVFTNDLAALQNTVGDRGIVIKGNPMEKEWQKQALEKISIYFNSDKQILYNNYRQKNYQWASSLSWENQAKKLLHQYILPNYLEYRNKYFHMTDMYKMILNYIKKDQCKKILDLHTHTGVSLINILNSFPDAIGYGLDDYKNNKDIEESFYKNVMLSGLQSRMYKIQSEDIEDSLFLLNKEYDLVNINKIDIQDDGYIYLVHKISWNLLKQGGVMILNTYSDEEDTSIPILKIIDKKKKNKDQIHRFLEKHKNEYKLLGASFTEIFLEKL